MTRPAPRGWRTRSAVETRALAEALGRVARPGDVVLLVGALGAGKTCFVQGLARGLGVAGAVKSPTFVLLVEHHGRVPLAHLDLYRIDDRRALEALGIEELIDSHVLAVEWGEKIEERMDDGLVVELREEGSDVRAISARALGGRGRERAEAWWAAAGAADLPAAGATAPEKRG